MSKIPGECCVCGEPLARSDMEGWVSLCERRGIDPVAAALDRSPPGVPCFRCMARLLSDAYENGEEVATRAVHRMRASELGLKVVKGGR